MRNYRSKLLSNKEKLEAAIAIICEVGSDLELIYEYYKSNDLDIGSLSNAITSLEVVNGYLVNTNSELDNTSHEIKEELTNRES